MIQPQYQFGIGTGFGVKDVVNIIRLVVTNSCTRVDFYNYFHVHDKLAKFEFILFKILTNIIYINIRMHAHYVFVIKKS